VVDQSENQVAAALIAVVAAPIAGFLSMAMIWALVTSDGRGGIDYGVLLAGASVAAVVVAAYARWQTIGLRAAVPWLLAAFLTTFLLAFGVVWLFYTSAHTFDFPKNFN
jgi:hypothetical protein